MKKVVFLALLSATASPYLQAETLREYGAMGDGVADDTQAIFNAIDNHQPEMGFLDGENQTYLIKKRVDVNKSMAIKNARFLFAPDASYLANPSNYRAFLIRGAAEAPLQVELENIALVRGGNKTSGSMSDSAGIWIDNANRVTLSNVEVSGNGRGPGVLIADSDNVTINDLYVHDMFWSPCREDESTLTKNSLLSRKDWSSRMIHDPANCGSDNLIRIEEQIAGLLIVRSNNIRINNPSIERIYAHLIDGAMPYQTDGITIGSNFDDLDKQANCEQKTDRDEFNIEIRGAKITDVWEGIDFTGNPLADILVDVASISRTHAFGVKFANGASCALVKNVTVTDSGLSGFVLTGKNNPDHSAPAPHSVTFDNTVAINPGSNGYWRGVASIAGYRIMNGALQDPTDIRIINSKSVDTQTVKTMDYGFFSEACDAALTVSNLDSLGHRIEGLKESSGSCR
ncbi:hypothetical protein [Hahella sp. NBU794]|uniref:hypothetical protein n=1 Tax=Hahella sp. NBU794 TaxID=3422590 RepID=UPI003D6EAC57